MPRKRATERQALDNRTAVEASLDGFVGYLDEFGVD